MTEGMVIDVGKSVGLYLALVALGTPVTWGLSEAVGKALKASELRAAMVFGPLVALLFWSFGWLPMLPVIFEGEAAKFIVNGTWAVVTGLCQTFAAKKLNDGILKPAGLKLPARGGDLG